MATSGTIRCGMGGWTFAPWEGTFYPDKLSKKKQLEYASRQVRTIEVNGTYYSGFKPETYAKWAAETPGDFVFSIKGRGDGGIRISARPQANNTTGTRP